MSTLLVMLRHDPMLGLLVFVPAVFAAEAFSPEPHTLLFVLSVLAARGRRRIHDSGGRPIVTSALSRRR